MFWLWLVALLLSGKKKINAGLNVFFQYCEHHTQLSILLHFIRVEVEISKTDISKPGQLKPKVSAWLDTTRGGLRKYVWFFLFGWGLWLRPCLITPLKTPASTHNFQLEDKCQHLAEQSYFHSIFHTDQQHCHPLSIMWESKTFLTTLCISSGSDWSFTSVFNFLNLRHKCCMQPLKWRP